ncbi:putative dioxygenase component [Sphingobium indicum BiD32]|uniref:Dioxygenase component n=1 Tax=Sphingobium indicum BiD32 TaxID=1301087 RepID=N1MF27_9SPHN|nr:aromatic-ring-hydroxylating dioxygenase subunit beta [Sphingobium indicum]CCW15835.1 putative dioxygenase component [Sphingobium indicum BiD32]
MMAGTATLDSPAEAVPIATTLEDLLLYHEISQFIYREARLQDDHQYDAWEALWADDALYWVPANGDDSIDPDHEMSIIYDNRSRIALRIRQLHTGRRWAQEPRSNLRRTISNVEVTIAGNGDVHANANGIIYESHPRGDVVWAAQFKYVLRRIDGGLRMARKTVLLPNNDTALWSMAFLV